MVEGSQRAFNHNAINFAQPETDRQIIRIPAIFSIAKPHAPALQQAVDFITCRVMLSFTWHRQNRAWKDWDRMTMPRPQVGSTVSGAEDTA